MEFETQYRQHVRFVACPGNRNHILYSAVYDDDGNIQLEESGVEDLYDYIQSFRDSVDINILLRKYQAGDVTALSKRQGAYFDASGMPRTYMEMLNLVIGAEQAFNALPLEEREMFGFSFEKWLASLDKVTTTPEPETAPVAPAEPAGGEE